MQGYEDSPPGDEYYSGACGENSGAHRRFPPLPSGWAPAASQHVALTKVKLPPFWTRESRSWFALAESTFHRSGNRRHPAVLRPGPASSPGGGD